MELAEFVRQIKIVEVHSSTRVAAIYEMARAAAWGRQSFDLEQVLGVIEDREAAAQMVVAPGFALPHAVIDWDGECCIVLGRSRAGVEYGVRGSPKVHLIVLLVVGRNRHGLHLELLGCIAELLGTEELRRAVLRAPDTAAIGVLLRVKAGIEPEEQPRRTGSVPRLNSVLVRQAVQMVDSLSAQALLVALDRVEGVPWKQLAKWEGRLLLVAADAGEEPVAERPDTHVFDIPHKGLSRTDRANLGLLLASSSGLLEERGSVICVAGPEGARLDSIMVVEPRSRLRGLFAEPGKKIRARLRPAVILRVLALALELAAEGREGRPVGSLFAIGDSRRVQAQSRQLVLNPFHGFSRALRNILDPSLAETIKEFAQIDGAFLVRDDGTVITAGAYLMPESPGARLPAGLGSRHRVAAGITASTGCLAVTVSQSTGKVSVFHLGRIVLELERASQTRW